MSVDGDETNFCVSAERYFNGIVVCPTSALQWIKRLNKECDRVPSAIEIFSRSRTELVPTKDTRQTALLQIELATPKCVILS